MGTTDAATYLRAEIDDLHSKVRQGKFTECEILAERCLNLSQKGHPDELYYLRAHTLAWEVYDALGKWNKAAAILNDDIWHKYHSQIKKAIKEPTRFAEQEFPSTCGDDERAHRYRIWRQRVMIVLAKAFSRFRAEDYMRAKPLLALAEAFLDKCLGKISVGVGRSMVMFACSGTRCRLYYFEGRILMRQRKYDDALLALDRSIAFCFARVDEQLKKPNKPGSSDGIESPSRHEVERSFATYCLAKITVHIAEIAYHQGHLRIARSNLLAARVQLRMGGDEFLTRRAELLLCMVDRENQNIVRQGWPLLARFRDIGRRLEGHPVYKIEASMEETTTAVYLLHAAEKNPRPRGKPPQDGISSFNVAFTRIKGDVASVAKLGLPETLFHALLVKGRILTRQKNWGEAEKAVDDAEEQLKKIHPPSARIPLAAEAKVVRARNQHARGEKLDALEIFRGVLRDPHESFVFRFSCYLHVLELLLSIGNLGEAEDYIAPCQDLLPNVDSVFQRERFEILSNRLESQAKHTIYFNRRGFTLTSGQRNLRKRYIIYLAQLIDKKPSEILEQHNWNRLVRDYGISVEEKPEIELGLKQDFSGYARAGQRRESQKSSRKSK